MASKLQVVGSERTKRTDEENALTRDEAETLLDELFAARIEPILAEIVKRLKNAEKKITILEEWMEILDEEDDGSDVFGT
jgi:hypothetical protein